MTTTRGSSVGNAWARAAGSAITLLGAAWLFSAAYLPILDPDAISKTTSGATVLPAAGATILALSVAVSRAFVNLAPTGRSRLPLDFVCGVLGVGIGLWISLGAYELPLSVAAAAVVTYGAVIVQDALTSS